MNLDFLNDMISKIETKANSVKLLNNKRHDKMDQARKLIQGFQGQRRIHCRNRRKSPRPTRLNRMKPGSAVVYRVGNGKGDNFQLTRIETRPFNPDTDMWPSK